MNATNLSLQRVAPPRGPGRFVKTVGQFVRTLFRLIGTLFVIGFSLLPLSALLVALPAVSPHEAVLTDSVRPLPSWWARTRRRLLAAMAGVVVLVALIAFAMEVVARAPLPSGGQMATLAKKVLSYSVADFPVVSWFIFPEDPRPADIEPLKSFLDKRDNARKELINPDLSPEQRRAYQNELAEANAAIANWAEEPANRWIVPAELFAQRQAASPTGSDMRRTLVDEAIAERVADVTKRWLPADELLKSRDSFRKAASRPNLNPRDQREAEKRLAEVEREIAERTPHSPKLRLLQDPDLQPLLGVPLWTLLPPVLVEQWPFVFLIVYGTDLILLLLIGKVPLSYNWRYLWVRKRDTALTAVAFTVVVALVVVLLAFVNGMYKLNETTGVPGNVLVLSEGSTDELFSNLARGGDIENAIKATVMADAMGRPIGPNGQGVSVARGTFGPDGRFQRFPVGTPKDTPGEYLKSFESYVVLNQAIPTKPGEPPKRRFLQLRAFDDIRIGAIVHDITLEEGGRWFNTNAVEPGEKAPDGLEYLQCCLGEGVAVTLGEDQGKARLTVGDTFELGDRWWKVVGLMKTRGTTYGSEIWTGIQNPVVRASGKGDKFSTLVLRMEDDSDESARAMAYFLNEIYTQAKLKAFAESDYYKELTKTNEQFLTAIVLMAVIMAVGGIFGVMNTMFASIAARIREVGVLRILGFKRWQILISFMLESLTIAFVGGFLGCLIGYCANGFEAASTLSGGQGGGKSVTLTMQVDTPIIATGLLFTLVMGRLGGLVPALSAMRMEILESLR
ncbi:MAG: ABC transporter permease [Gemmataceae bacterium]|nr:ABC transporter permease [Gemmata sp.]MDW8197243.1 ABC transporter permease [Gemmataceae bacterium]